MIAGDGAAAERGEADRAVRALEAGAVAPALGVEPDAAAARSRFAEQQRGARRGVDLLR